MTTAAVLNSARLVVVAARHADVSSGSENESPEP